MMDTTMRSQMLTTEMEAIGYMTRDGVPVICKMDTQMRIWALRKRYRIIFVM